MIRGNIIILIGLLVWVHISAPINITALNLTSDIIVRSMFTTRFDGAIEKCKDHINEPLEQGKYATHTMGEDCCVYKYLIDGPLINGQPNAQKFTKSAKMDVPSQVPRLGQTDYRFCSDYILVIKDPNPLIDPNEYLVQPIPVDKNTDVKALVEDLISKHRRDFWLKNIHIKRGF